MIRNFFLFFIFVLILASATNVNAANFQNFPENQELNKVFDSFNNNSKVPDTLVRLITKNDRAWYARWKMIEEAKDTIDCTYYIVDKDIFGQAFIGLLMHKAKQGVKVRLMIDGRVFRMSYMKTMPDKIQELASIPNVEVKIFNAISKSILSAFLDFKNVIASNHDKIIIADGKTCIIGGRNIGADYFVGKGENDIVYRETDVLMQGDYVAGALKTAFEDEWVCLKNKIIKPDIINWDDQRANVDMAFRVMNRYINGRGTFNPQKVKLSDKLKKSMIEMNKEITKYKGIIGYASYEMFQGQRKLPVKILDKHSYIGKINDITPNIGKMIDVCKHEVIIQNPYLVITETAENALVRASKRGVKIIFHTNSANSTDSMFPQAFLMNDWKRLLKTMPTARILVAPCVNTRIHSKTFVFDAQIAVVGTYNMDPLSESVNSEVVAAVNNKQFGKRAQLRIYDDLKNVVEYKIELDANGKIIKSYGPKDHVSDELIQKMNRLKKLKWLRPVI